MRNIFLFILLLTSLFAKAQNVGIGTNTPAAKLDIIGNIKITDGTQSSGKVLTTDANGLATWQNACLQNQVIFSTPGAASWPVPAGVTKVFAEVWSGGGNGSYATLNPPQIVGGGGGSGAYANVYIDVSAGGTITMNVANAGANGSPDYSSLSYGYFMNLGNGYDGSTSTGFGGGGTLTFNNFPNALIMQGKPGSSNIVTNFTVGATTYTQYRGGYGAAAPFGGSEGAGEVYHNGFNSGGSGGGFPGGGGGARTVSLGSSYYGGSKGCIIIHY
jgi:hypothetical protein